MATVVLVHGAFADSDSWNGLIGPLRADGHRVVAYANPLRGLATDAAPLSDLLRTLEGPIVLVGHSYGGAVLTAVGPDAGDIVAAVYVAGFALQPGESAADASALTPGSTLGRRSSRCRSCPAVWTSTSTSPSTTSSSVPIWIRSPRTPWPSRSVLSRPSP